MMLSRRVCAHLKALYRDVSVLLFQIARCLSLNIVYFLYPINLHNALRPKTQYVAGFKVPCTLSPY